MYAQLRTTMRPPAPCRLRAQFGDGSGVILTQSSPPLIIVRSSCRRECLRLRFASDEHRSGTKERCGHGRRPHRPATPPGLLASPLMIVGGPRNGSSGLRIGNELEARALGRRRELVHHGAVRNVDEAQPALQFAAVQQRRHRRNHRSAATSAILLIALLNVRRGKCFTKVIYDINPLLTPTNSGTLRNCLGSDGTGPATSRRCIPPPHHLRLCQGRCTPPLRHGKACLRNRDSYGAAPVLPQPPTNRPSPATFASETVYSSQSPLPATKNDNRYTPGLTHDRPNSRHVVVFHPASQRVSHQLPGHGPDKHIRPAPAAHSANHRPIDLRTIRQHARRVGIRRAIFASVRHPPTASRSPHQHQPSGSRALWHPARAAFSRCCSIRCRTVSGFPPAAFSFSGGTPAGGGFGGVPMMFSSSHFPRCTGDVRVATDVTINRLPWPRRPRRASSVVYAPVLASVNVSEFRNAAPTAR